MSHFYGRIQGNRGEATRSGTKGSGYHATAAIWSGYIVTSLWFNERTGYVSRLAGDVAGIRCL